MSLLGKDVYDEMAATIKFDLYKKELPVHPLKRLMHIVTLSFLLGDEANCYLIFVISFFLDKHGS